MAEGDHSFVDAFVCQRDQVVAILAFGRRVVGSCTSRITAKRPDFYRFFFFRNAASASKYIKAVRWIDDYLQCPLSFESRSLTQALKSGIKLENLKVKFKDSIRWGLLCRMVKNDQECMGKSESLSTSRQADRGKGAQMHLTADFNNGQHEQCEGCGKYHRGGIKEC